MNPDRQQVCQYLRSSGYFWRWTESGTVLVWRDGSTIAFREEIAQILEWLAPNGLPPFGAIVFLLAAFRSKIPDVADVVVEAKTPLPTNMGNDAAVLLSARQQLKAQLEAALTQLVKVSKLPTELNTGIKARCILAEAVFEPARAERHIEASAILRGLRKPLSDTELTYTENSGASGSYIRQIHIVAEGLKLHTAESLLLRLRTGLDALPQEIDADLPSAERARRLIEELSRDSEFGAVARAARELVAAVRLPRRLGEREELAIGGVADITNRGPLDRLLLSELAHDDLTLAVRVALNEALYFRREPPMREPPGTLALLLDSGVRLWGVPRVLATAVALALVARDKQHSEVLAWRAQGKQLQPVDLLSRNGLTQHLGALETGAHPGEALPAFSNAVPPAGQNQTVLITHRDALDDPDFRRALAEHPVAPGFVAAVDRTGRFELHAMPFARRPPLCEADLDLAAIFDENTGVAPIKLEVEPGLPAIFGVRPFPFLLPLTGKVDHWIKANDGYTYAVLNERRWGRFRDQRNGARELASDLPPGKTVWMDYVDGTVFAVKKGTSQRPARLLAFSLPDGSTRVMDLAAGSELLAVHRDGEVLLLIRTHDIRAYALSDGRMLGRTLNALKWVQGRYFRGEKEFHFVVWDGEAVKFEPVTLPTTVPAANVVLIFDRTGMEGPWVLLRNGEVVSTATDERETLLNPNTRFGFETAQVSKDGHQLFFNSNDPLQHKNKTPFLYGLKSGEQKGTFETGQAAKRLFDSTPLLPAWNLFRAIAAFGKMPGFPVILGKRGQWRQISLTSQGNTDSIRIWPRSAAHMEHYEKVAFAPARKTNHGCLLQTAEWPSGSKVFLDSRGLLHLKSRDPALPEVSLMLSDGEVAGWTSDGHVCGPAFFFENEYQSEPKLVFERVMQFLKHL